MFSACPRVFISRPIFRDVLLRLHKNDFLHFQRKFLQYFVGEHEQDASTTKR
jgi:hypothetical protein